MPYSFNPGGSNGLLGGIGAGLQAGVQAYQSQKQLQMQQAQQDFTHALLLMQARNQGLEKGYQVDPNTGSIMTDEQGNPMLTPMTSQIAQFGRQMEGYKTRLDAEKALGEIGKSGGPKAVQAAREALGQIPTFGAQPPQAGLIPPMQGADSPFQSNPSDNEGGDSALQSTGSRALAPSGGLIGAQNAGMLGVQQGLLRQKSQASAPPEQNNFAPFKMLPPIPQPQSDMGEFELKNFDVKAKQIQALQTKAEGQAKEMRGNEEYKREEAFVKRAVPLLAEIKNSVKNPTSAQNLPTAMAMYEVGGGRLPGEAFDANEEGTKQKLKALVEKYHTATSGMNTAERANWAIDHVNTIAEANRKQLMQTELNSVQNFANGNQGYEPAEFMPSILDRLKTEPVRKLKDGTKVYFNPRNLKYEEK